MIFLKVIALTVLITLFLILVIIDSVRKIKKDSGSK
jgi:hypothetical protein